MQKFVIIALYHFVNLNDCQQLQVKILHHCVSNNIQGTILLAHEGINGTIEGSRKAIDSFLAMLYRDPRFNNLEYKESHATNQSFCRMRVRLKKEIVTIGLPEVNPNKIVGKYIDPKDWNQLINDRDVLVLDTRNNYEIEIGTFKNAVNPNITKFRQFPEYIKKNVNQIKNRKIAIFCTGGIRCEKASSYMLDIGFKEVSHLKGGILKYIEEIPKKTSMWHGECFVFDNRVAIDHTLNIGTYDQCYGCRCPINNTDKQSEYYRKGICCHKCYNNLNKRQIKHFTKRHNQIQLANRRGKQHIS